MNFDFLRLPYWFEPRKIFDEFLGEGSYSHTRFNQHAKGL